MLYLCAVHQMKGDVAARVMAVGWQLALTHAPPKAQLDLVLDCFGFQLLLNLDPIPLVNLAESLDSYFAERFNGFYVVDMPAAAQFIWKAIEKVLPPKTRKKVHFVSRSSEEDMDLLYEACRNSAQQAML